MISGINKLFEHDGKKLHIQAEDLGDSTAAFEIRVYDGGSVLWLKRISYEDLKTQELAQREYEATLRAQMEKMVLTVEAGIVKGKIATA